MKKNCLNPLVNQLALNRIRINGLLIYYGYSEK